MMNRPPMSLSEWMEENPGQLFKNSELPESTREAIIDYFQFRRVCDDKRFGVYFNRELNRHEYQYTIAARFEAVKIDPMIADYMEREITDESRTSNDQSMNQTRNTETNQTGNTTTTHDTQNRTTYDTTGKTEYDTTDQTDQTGTDKTTYGKTSTRQTGRDQTGTQTNTTEHGTKIATTRTDTTENSGTDTETTTGTDATQYGRKSDTTSGGKDTVTETSHRDSKANSAGLQGSPPQSAVNPAGGFPDKLAWQYASAQTEGRDNTSEDTSRTAESEKSGTGTEQLSGADTVTRNGSRTTEHGHKITLDSKGSQDTTGTDTATRTDDLHENANESIQDGGEDSRESSQNTTTTITGTDTTTHTGTDTTALTGTDKQDLHTEGTGLDRLEGMTQGSSSSESRHRERYSGRHEAPQDLIKRAREFILSSNSFQWLLHKLEPCFYSVYLED